MNSTPTNPSDKPSTSRETLLPGEQAAAASEQPCPECGEMVRSGLVRCWNCGAFLKKEMAERYAKMQANPAPIVFSEVPEGEAVALGDMDDDDDFELKVVEIPAAKAETSDAPAAAPDERPAASEGGESDVPHSVATGGDVLLQVALSEQAESRRKRKQRGVSLKGGARTPGGFVIYCPYGCRIEVKDQHRGMTGRCPKCQAPFVVPIDPPDYGFKARDAAAAAETAASSPTGIWTPWLADLHLHQVQPEKLKLKPGSLAREFVEVDAGVSPEGLLMVSLAAKKSGGLFGGGSDKKKPETRSAVQQHLKDGKPVKDLPASDVQLYKPDVLHQLRVAHPTTNPAESMFAGVPVFGEKVIAVQLPLTEGQPPRFLSFGLTGFRKFAEAVRDAAGGPDLRPPGVPMTDDYVDYTCHYSDVPIHALQNLEWYQADPQVEPVLAGWKCAACGLTISEESRKKENLGGKGGKGLAKVKCPKCSNKFGEQPLYTLPEKLAAPAMGESAAAKE